MAQARYSVSSSAGQRDGKRHAVLDHHDRQGGKGIRRVSFHATLGEAVQRARALNAEHERQQRYLAVVREAGVGPDPQG